MPVPLFDSVVAEDAPVLALGLCLPCLICSPVDVPHRCAVIVCPMRFWFTDLAVYVFFIALLGCLFYTAWLAFKKIVLGK